MSGNEDVGQLSTSEDDILFNIISATPTASEAQSLDRPKSPAVNFLSPTSCFDSPLDSGSTLDDSNDGSKTGWRSYCERGYCSPARFAVSFTCMLCLLALSCIVLAGVYLMTAEANKVIYCHQEGESVLLYFEGEEYFTIAYDSCTKRNGSLLSITDKIQNQFILEKVQTIYKGSDIWLDYSDDSIEGTWLNEEGVQINFTFWNESQPDGSIYENCVILAGESGNWFDVSCYEHHPWICRIHHASDCTPYY